MYINCDFEVTSPQHNHHNKNCLAFIMLYQIKYITILFNSSITKKIKSPVSRFIYKFLISIASLCVYDIKLYYGMVMIYLSHKLYCFKAQIISN